MWTATTSFGRNIHLLLQRIEVVDYDTDEEVEGEEWSADDEDDEVEVVVEARFILRLLVNLTNAKTITNLTKYYTNTVCLVSYQFSFTADGHSGVFSLYWGVNEERGVDDHGGNGEKNSVDISRWERRSKCVLEPRGHRQHRP